MALLEAMYMKKVCVVSNVVGNRDVIHNRRNGYVCDSVFDYIEIIKKLKIQKNIKQIITNAKNEVIEHYNSQIMADQYKRIYLQSLEYKGKI